jgi:hypothetical protein
VKEIFPENDTQGNAGLFFQRTSAMTDHHLLLAQILRPQDL